MLSKKDNMATKNIKISEEHHSKLICLCANLQMTQKDFIESAIDVFDKLKESPKSNTTNHGLRNTFVSFIRQQEKDYLKPIKNDMSIMNERMDSLMENIKFIYNKL